MVRLGVGGEGALASPPVIQARALFLHDAWMGEGGEGLRGGVGMGGGGGRGGGVRFCLTPTLARIVTHMEWSNPDLTQGSKCSP